LLILVHVRTITRKVQVSRCACLMYTNNMDSHVHTIAAHRAPSADWATVIIDTISFQTGLNTRVIHCYDFLFRFLMFSTLVLDCFERFPSTGPPFELFGSLSSTSFVDDSLEAELPTFLTFCLVKYLNV